MDYALAVIEYLRLDSKQVKPRNEDNLCWPSCQELMVEDLTRFNDLTFINGLVYTRAWRCLILTYSPPYQRSSVDTGVEVSPTHLFTMCKFIVQFCYAFFVNGLE